MALASTAKGAQNAVHRPTSLEMFSTVIGESGACDRNVHARALKVTPRRRSNGRASDKWA